MKRNFDPRMSMSLIRSRARLVISAGVVGLLLGCAWVVFGTPRMTSSVLLLLPTPTADSAGLDIGTEVKIATSQTILAQAGQAVTPHLSAGEVGRRIKVKASTEQLLQIEAFGTTGAEAHGLAKGMGEAFLAYSQHSADQVKTAALADMQGRRDKLQQSVDAVDQEISSTKKRAASENPNSSDGRRDAQLLAQLQVEQADLVLQLDKVKDEMNSGQTSTTQNVSGLVTQVQEATPPVARSLLAPLLLWGPSGFLAGAGLVAVLLLAQARRDRKLRMRDEVADAVGSAVITSVRSRPVKSVAAWSMLLQDVAISPVDEWAFRQLLRTLATTGRAGHGARVPDGKTGRLDHPRSLTVLSLAGDERALTLGPRLAAFTATLGIPTRLLVGAGGEHATELWAACTQDRGASGRLNLVVGEVQPGEVADLTIVVAVADREMPQFGYSLRTEACVLAVAAGAATDEDLARVSVAVDDQGGQIDGVVMTEPDRADRTTGRFTAEERGKQVALPIRLVGVADQPNRHREGGR